MHASADRKEMCECVQAWGCCLNHDEYPFTCHENGWGRKNVVWKVKARLTLT